MAQSGLSCNEAAYEGKQALTEEMCLFSALPCSSFCAEENRFASRSEQESFTAVASPKSMGWLCVKRHHSGGQMATGCALPHQPHCYRSEGWGEQGVAALRPCAVLHSYRAVAWQEVALKDTQHL